MVWGLGPALPTDDRLILLERAARVRRNAPLGFRRRELDELARTHGVGLRTLYRYLNDSFPCPGYPEGSCLTKVRGGGLCGFCRRTKALP